MNSIYDKRIKVNKKNIQSDDEDFEEEEEVEVELEEEEITNEINELYKKYDIDKVADLFKNIDLFGDKIYNKCIKIFLKKNYLFFSFVIFIK